MTRRREVPPVDSGPTIQAVPFTEEAQPGPTPLLTPRQRQRLIEISTRIHVPARKVLYRQSTPATTVYFNMDGVVKVFRDLPSGRRWVTAFLFPRDVFGLAQNGLYVRTAQAVTDLTLYSTRVDILKETLRSDAELQFQFLCKVTHELREAQRHTIMVGRRDAAGRLAMFIRQLEQRSTSGGNASSRGIDMPMTRADVANYLGLSPEAISRATRLLEQRGMVKFTGRHRLQILDRPQFDRLVSKL